MSLFRAFTSVFSTSLHRFLRPSAVAPQLCLAGDFHFCDHPSAMQHQQEEEDDIIEQTSIWFAVPKKKVSPGKKRMKTTRQKRIKLKTNIVVDNRTGELTLMHKLPFNWKDYLPKMDDFSLSAKGAAALNIKAEVPTSKDAIQS